MCCVLYQNKVWRENSGKRKAHKHKSFWLVTPPVTGGVSRPGGQGSKFYVLSSEPKKHIFFLSGHPTARTGDRGDRKKFYVQEFYEPFLHPKKAPQSGPYVTDFRFGKRGLLEKGSFQKSLAILENLEILENPQTLENRGEFDHFLEILANREGFRF